MGACVYTAGSCCLASGRYITAGNYTAFLPDRLPNNILSLSLFSLFFEDSWRLNASTPQQIKDAYANYFAITVVRRVIKWQWLNMFSDLLFSSGKSVFHLSSFIALYTYNPPVSWFEKKRRRKPAARQWFYCSFNHPLVFLVFVSFSWTLLSFWHPLLLLFSLPICFSILGWLLPCPALWTWRISQWTFRPVPCSLKAVSLLRFLLSLLSHFPLFIYPLFSIFYLLTRL